jgi:hypothetical protein
VTGALSRLELAWAAAACRSYEDFLDLRKHADPDIPIYQQAKAEYDKLRKC